jgi:hypothetical protein
MFLSGSAVAHQNVGVRSGHHRAPDLQAGRRQNVALLAVHVMQQRDARAAVGIVLNRRDAGRDTVLVALEIDLAIGLLVPAAAEPRRNPAGAVERPPVARLPATRLFSGFCLVMSSRETTVWKRRVGRSRSICL